jgi:hypothetical protein
MVSFVGIQKAYAACNVKSNLLSEMSASSNDFTKRKFAPMVFPATLATICNNGLEPWLITMSQPIIGCRIYSILAHTFSFSRIG